MPWVLKEKKAQSFTHAEKSIVSEAGKQSQPWVNAALLFSCSDSDPLQLLQNPQSPLLLPRLVCHQSSLPFVPFLRRAWVSTTRSFYSTPACLFQVGFVFSSLWWLCWSERVCHWVGPMNRGPGWLNMETDKCFVVWRVVCAVPHCGWQ